VAAAAGAVGRPGGDGVASADGAGAAGGRAHGVGMGEGRENNIGEITIQMEK